MNLNPKLEILNAKQTQNSKLKIFKLIQVLNLGFWICLGFSVSGLVFTQGCQKQQLYRDNRVLMGTFIEVSSPDERAAKIVFDEIKRIEALLSKYDADSEIAKLNRLGKLKVSPETFYIVKKAKEFTEVSAGAFDISVGPLIDLWGFTDKKYSVPNRAQIRENLAKVGSDKIILHADEFVIEFKTSGMKIDLGAVGKGYALDCAVEKLRAAGISSCLINAGGQVYALGDKFGQLWKIAVQDPRHDHPLPYYLQERDKSISTSGDYEQFFFSENKRYSHIINPKTGYPAESGIISVTIIAKDGLTADALSTAIFVLGKEKGMELLKKFPGVEAKIIDAKNS